MYYVVRSNTLSNFSYPACSWTPPDISSSSHHQLQRQLPGLLSCQRKDFVKVGRHLGLLFSLIVSFIPRLIPIQSFRSMKAKRRKDCQSFINTQETTLNTDFGQTAF